MLGLPSAAGSLFSSLSDFDSAMPLLHGSPFSLGDLASSSVGFSIVSPFSGQFAIVSFSASGGGRLSTAKKNVMLVKGG